MKNITTIVAMKREDERVISVNGGQIFVFDNKSFAEIEKMVEEANKLTGYVNGLYQIDALFYMKDISHAVYDSIKNAKIGVELGYNCMKVEKVSENLYTIK